MVLMRLMIVVSLIVFKKLKVYLVGKYKLSDYLMYITNFKYIIITFNIHFNKQMLKIFISQYDKDPPHILF